MKSALFDDWTWECRKLPKPFDDESKRRSKDYVSKYCTTSKRFRRATLHPIVTEVLKLLAESKSDTEDFAVGFSGNYRFIIVEYSSSTEENLELAVYDTEQGEFYAGIYEKRHEKIQAYSIEKDASTGKVLFFAFIIKAFENYEFMTEFNSFKHNFINGDIEASYRNLYVLNDNLYRRITNEKSDEHIVNNLDVGTKPFEFEGTWSIKRFEVGKIFQGTFKLFKVTKGKGSRLADTEDDFVGKYIIDEKRILSESEQSLVPVLPNWFTIPPEALLVCKHIQATTESNLAMRNFMLSGPAGTGKTESAKAIAAGLNLPYLYFTCSANTEACDLIGQILPEMEDDEEKELLVYPTFEDIRMDPSSAYATLTGEYISDITEDTAYTKLLETVRENAFCGNGERRYKFVKSPIIRALEQGYVIEIQEPTVISNPGVLVGLNGLLDREGLITLPDGSVVSRHPDSIVIITTNNDYNGCMEMNQSIISRMNLVIHQRLPEKNIVIERAAALSGFTDIKLIEKMYEVFERIAARCKETSITDGSVGFREFSAWVLSTKITENPYESAMLTVIASASNYEENRNELINTCLEPVFSED